MESFDLTASIFLKALALIYCIAFVNAANQYVGLLGEQGLLPIRLFLQRVDWKCTPTLFFWNHSDLAIKVVSWAGVFVSCLALTGVSEKLGFAGHLLIWSILWALYLSLVNAGQIFYGFGWESLLLETGFIAIFLPPEGIATPVILIWIIRWTLFRIMFGAGMIKLRGDKCWKDLTCLYFYYETQPMPNPLSRFFHRLPLWFHRLGVIFNHFVELIVPWGLLLPGTVGAIAGLLTVVFQATLIISGNLSWLNYLTLILCIACFNDAFWTSVLPMEAPEAQFGGWIYTACVYAFAGFVAYRSWAPVKNMFSSNQVMNTCYDPFHLVNTYGAFGSITKRRFEIIIEGTNDDPGSETADWKEYQFKGKPGDVRYRPPIVAPYHLRLDWLMWFAAMGSYSRHPWIIHLIKKLLEGNTEVTKLLRSNPFEGSPPKYMRAQLYRYHFAVRATGKWWERKWVGEYIPVLNLEDHRLLNYCERFGWEVSQEA